MATVITREALAGTAHAGHLDEAMDEVFRMMIGLECSPEEDGGTPLASGAETISAVIGLAGAISGACVLQSDTRAALCIAEALVGVRPESLDETVKDAVGEVCNMVAGAWKGRYAALSSGCMLSTPTVVTGTNYRLHTQRPEFRVDRSYRFAGNTVCFSIVCDSIQ